MSVSLYLIFREVNLKRAKEILSAGKYRFSAEGTIGMKPQ